MLYLEWESELDSKLHFPVQKTGKVETECYLGTKGTSGRQRKTFCWSRGGDKENAHSAEVIFVDLCARSSKRAQTQTQTQSRVTWCC